MPVANLVLFDELCEQEDGRFYNAPQLIWHESLDAGEENTSLFEGRASILRQEVSPVMPQLHKLLRTIRNPSGKDVSTINALLYHP